MARTGENKSILLGEESCKVDRNKILLVDEEDHVIGYGEKLPVHEKELLHRAFSIFIYDRQQQKLLLQKRAYGKYHSGGLWTNACCSHPRQGESMQESLNARLAEELGMSTDFSIKDPGTDEVTIGSGEIYSCGHFTYYAPYEGLAEHEIDHVFVYLPDAPGPELAAIRPNPEEIAELAWIGLAELDEWLAAKPQEFTAWFAPAYELAGKTLEKLLFIP